MKKILMGALALSTLIGVNANALVDNNLKVTATVASGCTITASDVKFGEYIATEEKRAVMHVSMTCTKSTSYKFETVANDKSGNDVGLEVTEPHVNTNSYGVMRKIGDGTEKLLYQLFIPWYEGGKWDEDFNIPGQYKYFVGTGEEEILDIQFTLPAKQFASPGNYSGTHTLTLSY